MECAMIFDFRTYLGDSFDGVSQSADELLSRMDGLQIDKALVCPLKPHSYDLVKANHDLGEIISLHNDRFVGAARIDPWQPEAAQTFKLAVESFNFRALYLNPWEETFRVDIERVDPLFALAAEYKIPVLISTGYPWLSEALQVCNLALRWPTVPIIMTNGGQFNISGLGQADATLALSKSSNLYFDTAGIYRQDFIEDSVDYFGGERILFGSGSPYFDQHYELQRIRVSKVNQENHQAISYDNATGLLKFSSKEFD
jgi:predicted TIM-barrel fold metal-dependent hydrolase